jgi:tetratricopeptide (TPR) repeat protein
MGENVNPSPLASAVLATALLFAPGCGGDRNQRAPEVSVASAPAAQAEFRVLRARFFDTRGAERAALAPELRAFIARYPKDDRGDDVRVYLGWAYLEHGDRKAAQGELAPVLAGPPGARRDFARVAEAAILSRAGQAAAALKTLDTLERRIVDLDERYLYGEERARAAFLAHRYGKALEALLAWLAESPPDRLPHAQNSATTLLDLVPATDLVMELPGLRRGAGGAASGEFETARAWLRDTVLKRLVRLALERSDATLARRLLDQAPAALRATPEGQELVALSAEGSKAPAIAGRAVGLLLALGGPLERRRASAVSAGLTRALGSAQKQAGSARVELIVSYDAENVDAALTELFAQGAALLVSGADDETARLTARRAEAARVPLLLLRPLNEAPAPGGFTFVLGADSALVEKRLTDALVAGGRPRVARVGPGSVSCDLEPPGPGRPRFPLAAWRKDGVQALLVAGDAGCARDLAFELKGTRERWPLALGLDATEAFVALGALALTVKAGAFPEAAAGAGWYEALGHDAGLLAARALQALPEAGVARGESVRVLHEKARDALARAEAELWTSQARGFGGARVLPREIGVSAGGLGAHE